MFKNAKLPPKTNQSSTLPERKVKKHVKLTEITYRSNTDSDYTEKIEKLEKNFNYSSNGDYYWGPPQLSILYGTPLYEEASSSQKRAPNHFYWAKQYNQTAATEANEQHEGFHVNRKFHQRLFSDLCRSFEKIDYLWPVNREMRLMASGGSIAKAIQNNIKVFERFSKSVAHSN